VGGAPKIVGPKTFRITPAMATGVTDRLWETGDNVKNSRRSWMMYTYQANKATNANVGLKAIQ
jgi:hypothetical protein